LDISEENIQEHHQVHKQAEKVRKQAYHMVLNNPEDLRACYAAFGAGIQHRPERSHQDDLLEPPNTWSELQRYLQKEGFIQAAKKEYGDLFQQKTFKKMQRPKNTKVLGVC